ncbi:Gfo/Idh/MocA family protein [Halobellus rufus]|uniref:Gfo/Idh/MocA family protein n=1 Tax=Halobellus rufus TaxID=1448860 RepID=UPI001E36F2A8|nr:Gfo/Idh/MocA family oxidoreductase [Halobellus rufus]
MTIDVGVVGVGSMGRHHARVYHELPDVNLLGVADEDESTAAAVATEYDAEAASTAALLERVDAVSIAVPSRFHHEIGLRAIESGVHALVEKPMTPTVAEARSLVDAAAEAGVTLQVGHVERFNPAVIAVRDFVEDLDLVAVEARRLGPPVGDGRDVSNDVVFDLMIHDIDVIQSLVDGGVRTVAATGSPDREYVNASLQFDNDIVGSLTASRVSQRKVRELTLTATDCLVTVDYSDRAVWIDRRTRPTYLTDDGDLRYRSERVVERPTVDNGEPLKKELRAFVDAVRNRTTPVVTGEDGIDALSLATRIREAMQ